MASDKPLFQYYKSFMDITIKVSFRDIISDFIIKIRGIIHHHQQGGRFPVHPHSKHQRRFDELEGIS